MSSLVLGKILFAVPRHNALAEGGAGVIALSGVLLAYSATELAEGYGFIDRVRRQLAALERRARSSLPSEAA